MDLLCNSRLAVRYTSASQIARVLTEDWCARELYCPACSCDSLRSAPPNTQAIDFHCPQCAQPFQLKSGGGWNVRKIVDAGYQAMLRAIRTDRTPNLLVMQYSRDWAIENLLLVPRVFLTESVVEQRRPLSAEARRVGWVGCNILMSEIPSDGQIEVVSNGTAVPKSQVRQRFKYSSKLAGIEPALRGWTIDVLRIIRRLRRKDCALQELYRFESELRELHPLNKNIRPKIRQQLQLLRDMGFIKFVGTGRYSVLR